MNEDVNSLGPVQIEWIINRQQIAADLEATEQMYDETVGNIEEKAQTAGDAIAKLIAKGGYSDSKAEVDAYAASFGQIAENVAPAIVSIEELKQQLLAVQQAKAEFAALDPKVVGFDEYNTGLAALAQNEQRLKDAIAGRVVSQNDSNTATQQSTKAIEESKQVTIDLGKSGEESFEKISKSAGNSVSFLKSAWSGIRQIAYALPGIGIAGIVAFATGPIIEYVKALFTGKEALNEFVQTMKAFNEFNRNADKDAATQLSTLKLLYNAATDVKKSMDDRLAAAQKLRETYPDEFANASKLAIINGDVKKSYDEVTSSVLEYARSKAALSKISDLEAKNLDAQFQIDKNNAAKAAQIARAYATYQEQLKNQSPESAAASQRGDLRYQGSGGFFLTPLGTLKETIRQITEQTNLANLDSSQLIKTNNKVEDFLTGYVKTVDKGAEDLDKANKLLGSKLENLGALLKNAGSFQDLENIKSALEIKLKALAPDDAQISNYQQQIRKVEELEKQFQPKLTDGNADAESLKNKMALLRELAAANEQFNRRTLSDDQAALTAISDKFDQLRQKIAAFNANPKNKNNQIGQGDINALNPQEFAALGNQADLNETKYIELDLQKKKQLYAEYEAYREKVGKDAANAEYADLLKSGETFEAYIQTLQKSLTDVQNDISPAAFEDRKKLYEKYALDIQKINSSLNLGMLADTLSFQQQLSVIIENGLRKATLLYAAGKKAQGDLILSQAVDEVQLRVDSQQQLISQYKSFYDQISGMTKDEALLQVNFAKDRVKADLDANRISAATYQSLMTYIKQAEGAINSNTILNGLNAVAGALDNIATSAKNLDPAFSSVLSTIAQTISQVANLGKQINAFENGLANFSANKKSAGGGILGTVSTVAGMVPVVGSLISSVVGVVSSVVGAFKAAKESAIAAAKEMKSYQEGLIANEVKYNELLREQASAIKDINALNAQQLEQRKQLLAQQQLEAQSDYNKLLALIQNNGQQVTGEHTEKYGGFLGIARKTKVVQDLAGIGGADYDTLLKLYTEGKLSDETAKWFEQLKNVHDEMGNISDATAAVNDQIDKIFTGTTADSLEQAILTGLKNGKRGFPDFTGDFEQAMQTSLDSIFEDSYLKDKAAAFYKAFAAASESGGGLTPDEIAQLKSQYANLVNGASTAYEDLYKITGITPPSGSSSASNSGIVANSIKGISEVQANALEGITRGIQLAVNEIADNQPSNSKAMSDQLDEMRRQTLVQKNIEANTKRTADNTDKMVDSLASIATNTSTTGLTNTLRAAGII